MTSDECRFFSLVYEVHPGSEDEWAFWLDPAEGMIGWPEFQTKDGKVYPRLWAPGPSRVPPTDSIVSSSGLGSTRPSPGDHARP